MMIYLFQTITCLMYMIKSYIIKDMLKSKKTANGACWTMRIMKILKPIFYDEVELVKVLSDDYVKIILDGRETIVDKNGKIIS